MISPQQGNTPKDIVITHHHPRGHNHPKHLLQLLQMEVDMNIHTINRLESEKISSQDIQALEDLVAKVSAHSSLLLLVNTVLSAQASGEAVEFYKEDSELSPNRAAELIGMSRPFLLRFLRSGELKSHKVGTHQRIKMSDLKEFQDRRLKAQREVTEALAVPRDTFTAEFTTDELEDLDGLAASPR
ncbi:helix-turn-helix domain-containing protein [Rothia sp. LK2492]|uniref:helix-turn-helix domain-containing protein n=1 Tax=Rothia sp. LK2492 TaxID=3114370 RepID=UPI0034CFB27E